MQNVIEVQDTIKLTGNVIETGVSYEEYLIKFDGQHVEWVNGAVIEMSPVTKEHNALSVFLIALFDYFLSVTTGGRIFHDPMTMKPLPQLPGRLPDIQVILPENLHIVHETEVAGAADLVVEIVSPDSQRRDRVEKYAEYERGGVKEYWILDPMRQESLFHQLNALGVYDLIEPDEHGIYHSKVISKLKISADIFWREPLPRGVEIARLVEAMLKD